MLVETFPSDRACSFRAESSSGWRPVTHLSARGSPGRRISRRRPQQRQVLPRRFQGLSRRQPRD